MAKKQFTQSVIVRNDLTSKSKFSRHYKIDRKTLDKLIYLKMLSVETIDGLSYISIADPAVIDNALQYKNRSPQNWHTETPVRMNKKRETDSFDQRMDAAFEKYEREHQ